MKGSSRYLWTAVFVVSLAAAANATSFTFDMGPGSSIDTTDTNEELIMWAEVYDSVQYEMFTLNEGGPSYTFLFAMMGTHETWINSDDLNPGRVAAHVDFDMPDLIPEIGGTTIGFSAGFSFTQGWQLVWDGPEVVPFGAGGQFTVELSDASFQSGFWTGPDGLCGDSYADIYATVTLDRAPIIPEPATMSLLGLGIAGLAVVRRLRRL